MIPVPSQAEDISIALETPDASAKASVVVGSKPDEVRNVHGFRLDPNTSYCNVSSSIPKRL